MNCPFSLAHTSHVQKSAEQGDAEAQYRLGWMYYKGEGVAQSFETARKWHEQAATQGNAEAQYNLGLMYYTAKVLPNLLKPPENGMSKPPRRAMLKHNTISG